MSITEICYAVGFNNLSNFNRQFLAQKGMSPSRFRALLAENISAEMPPNREEPGGANNCGRKERGVRWTALRDGDRLS